MPADIETPEMVVKSHLKGYGLTDKLIVQLGPPDDTKPNPHYKSGPPMSLYKLDRVRKFVQENREAIEDVLRKRPKREAAARAAVDAKRQELKDWLAKKPLRISGTFPTLDQLWKRARYHAEGFRNDYGEYNDPGLNGLLATLRHEFTNYDSILNRIEGKVGCAEAYNEIRLKMDAMIEQMFCDHYGREYFESFRDNRQMR